MVQTDFPDNTSPRITSHLRRRFALAATLVSLWLVGLSVLSLFTANPVTLNRDQILEATDVLTAVVQDATSGRVRVEKSWKDAVHEDELTLLNLSETKPSVGDRLLIPVTTSRKGWRVTLSKLPHEPPLVYPATEESERQLRHLLKVGRLP